MSSFADVGLLDPLGFLAGDDLDLVSDSAYLAAMVTVEAALLGAFEDSGVGVPGGAAAVENLVDALDIRAIGAASAAGGNAVIPLLAALRPLLPVPVAGLLHTGATSQDVVDSAAMVVAAAVRVRMLASLADARRALAALADAERHTPTVGRTLGQHAAPTTFGLRMAILLDGIGRAADALAAVDLPAQFGGSVGTLAVLVDRFGVDRALAVRGAFAARLGLTDRDAPWHVERTPILTVGAALATVIATTGRLGSEVTALAGTDFAEVVLESAPGEGGSSAMPQKRNPVPAVLLVGAARRAPGLLGTLVGAALGAGERAAGDWHAEWQPLRELLRLGLGSAAAAARVAADIRPDAARMARNLEATGGAVHAERAQAALVPIVGRTEAARLVRSAVAMPGPAVPGAFETALIAALGDNPVAAAAVRVACAVGGPIGLSDTFIDSVIARNDL
jgi:3-carboxy-cis,cis-muconate cycloisomerase